MTPADVARIEKIVAEAEGADALARVIRPVVEGQIRSFLNDHPEIADAWSGKCSHKTRAQAVTASLAKRISRDLLCSDTRVRLASALLEHATGAQDEGGGVEAHPAPPGGRGGTLYCPGLTAQNPSPSIDRGRG